MIKIIELERDAKFYESIIPVFAAMGSDPATIKKFVQEYTQVLFPEIDFDKDSFAAKAHDVIDRYFGKPFILSTVGKGQHVMHPINQEE